MKFYQELTLLPDEENDLYFLWSKIYTQIHIALADRQNKYGNQTIGVSFPQYRCGKDFGTLGAKLRVFAPSEDELNQLNLAQWLGRLGDYVHLKSAQAVPENHRHAIFKRAHVRNMEKVAQEFAEFKGIDFQAALTHCQTHKTQPQNYPFIELKSETTGQNFKLHIVKETSDKAKIGEFSSYGLGGASVPDF
ncbi:type I-F CRISPR-associated endoribonuclease Cas6/Csy4 [Alysiella crassa]|uniref:CRISPR-associated protein Cas6/Csy4, subtype I-F/YPEST n=1 Tax=Alysiella crassa TaxID=153491 RepID=A0A376BM67_9NEIS|nr:type I-F CRISPR-associated endoribonuclease Cas6/Csy4 [Alysiella crassa]UOP06995.1 type I-F CRISPR-associated endoribonuclease Cas6/Csy4 [Alysiella crassa]SSY70862.1 CRISPR-associated protein Cas6/Csy4, subtype I-F/YPEST [Alysiella crassa]